MFRSKAVKFLLLPSEPRDPPVDKPKEDETQRVEGLPSSLMAWLRPL